MTLDPSGAAPHFWVSEVDFDWTRVSAHNEHKSDQKFKTQPLLLPKTTPTKLKKKENTIKRIICYLMVYSCLLFPL